MPESGSNVPEDQRRRFLDALAHKNGQNADPHNQHRDGSGKANAPHGAAGGQKMFRRKSV
jgi:hypothetical protein